MGKPFRLVLLAGHLFIAACAGSSPPTSPSAFSPALPHQSKGYELYSWQSGGTSTSNVIWTFVLITGTDRSKSIDEITSGPDAVTAAWVKVSAQGTDGLTSQLNRLPRDESIVWIGPQTREQWQLPTGPLELPPAAVLDSITGYCKQIGLNLQVLP